VRAFARSASAGTQLPGPSRERLAPSGVVSAAPELRWQPIAAGRYRVTVWTSTGRVVWRRELAGPPASWPEGVAAPPGDYRWKVEALEGEEVVGASSMTAFSVR
jgi:hypothetical protein